MNHLRQLFSLPSVTAEGLNDAIAIETSKNSLRNFQESFSFICTKWKQFLSRRFQNLKKLDKKRPKSHGSLLVFHVLMYDQVKGSLKE